MLNSVKAHTYIFDADYYQGQYISLHNYLLIYQCISISIFQCLKHVHLVVIFNTSELKTANFEIMLEKDSKLN